jgi:EAL domain-containing protein (putative c-di-GMP-specific phosphodiesterase class I)
VENERQLQKLRDKGCQEAQGFYFSRPLTAEGMAGWLRNGGGT